MVDENAYGAISDARLPNPGLNLGRDFVGAFTVRRDNELVLKNTHETKSGGSKPPQMKNGHFGNRSSLASLP